MDPVQQEVIEIFTRTKALLTGHFLLRSGLHSGHYFQCAQVCQDMGAVERLAELLVTKLENTGGLAFSTVVSLVTLNYSALQAELTLDYNERTSLATFRIFFSTISSILCALLPLEIVKAFPDVRTGWIVTGIGGSPEPMTI